LKFLQKNLDALNEDAIDEYSVPLGKLYRWVVMALDIRIEDIRRRKEEKANLKSEREEAQSKAQEREDKKNEELEAAKQAFEDKINAELEKQADEDQDGDGDEAQVKERPEFDEAEFLKTFNEANPEIVIPDEVEDDIDNDYDYEWKPEDKD
jgi:regulator of protease activity HflC (stomatin/prohibitin superfamily)